MTAQPKAPLYQVIDPESLGQDYLRHVDAMTSEGLHRKSDIAIQLAWRDAELRRQHAEIERLEAVNAELLEALTRIGGLNPETDSDEGFNEWGEADCFNQAQEIARAAIKKAEGK